MTPDQIRALRLRLNFTQAQFGALIGLAGKATSREVMICAYEGGIRTPSPRLQRLLIMIAAHGPEALADSPEPEPQLEQAAE
jgi:DNA-binding transcriptional regulator YiaG